MQVNKFKSNLCRLLCNDDTYESIQRYSLINFIRPSWNYYIIDIDLGEYNPEYVDRNTMMYFDATEFEIAPTKANPRTKLVSGSKLIELIKDKNALTIPTMHYYKKSLKLLSMGGNSNGIQ